MQLVQVVWRYSTKDNGELFAMITGILTMLMLYAGNLDITMRLKLFRDIQFLMVVDRYG